MRAVALLLIVPLLAGCIGSESDEDTTYPTIASSVAVMSESGDSIELIEENGKLTADLGTVGLPAVVGFEVPEHATMIRFIADPGDENSVSVSMTNADTGRRRCNQQTVEDFAGSYLGERSCSSIALIDTPGTQWTARASGSGEAHLRVEFYSSPIDGPAGQVDWSQLSKADHELVDTQGFYITAHDGAQLWVELTLPDGPGPWPTVIAASPYNGQAGRIPDPGSGETMSGTPAMWTYWTQDYAKRGYAAVNIDVRGFGKSGGCVEVWGENEQFDQKLIVDWVADQEWSNGNVGFYGQSYVATTPVAAAVQAPEALKAIIAVAPVIDAYHDWHFGGVPNGESSLSPVAYQVLTDMLGTNWILEDPNHATDVQTLLQYSTQGICDPTLIPLANDPRSIHGAYYDERDFGARAGDVTAAVLFTQGFEDANVKSAMIPDWFDAIEAPKLGVFGHWLHQHPARMDAEALFLGWMDEHVKGKDLGLADAYPNAVISINRELERDAETWAVEETLDFGLNNVDMSLGAADGSRQIFLQPIPEPLHSFISSTVATADVTYQTTLDADLLLHAPILNLKGSLTGTNGFVHATIHADGRLVTEGMRQLALSNDYETYTPITGNFDVDLPFRPTELFLEEGTVLQLTIRGVQLAETIGTAPPTPVMMTLQDSHLQFPIVEGARPISLTALP